MSLRATTIWGAARDRFAEWAPAARTQDGSRSLPGSPRLTDQDIWSATPCGVATDKSQCGSALAETARPGREDLSMINRCRFMRHTCWWAASPEKQIFEHAGRAYSQRRGKSVTRGDRRQRVRRHPSPLTPLARHCESTARSAPKERNKNDERLRTS
jgi:hypothetical protein